jgi:hypothetical protein
MVNAHKIPMGKVLERDHLKDQKGAGEDTVHLNLGKRVVTI